jgi:hypothetical protein
MRRKPLSRRFLILLVLVVLACAFTAYLLIFASKMCGCVDLSLLQTETMVAQTNIPIMTAVADTATASAGTLTPALDSRTATAQFQIWETQTAIGKLQTGTPAP